MWGDRRGENIEILDANSKQQHVKSICTVSALALDLLALPGWQRAPAKSIHPSLPERAKPAVRDRRQEHALAEVVPRGEKWRKWQKKKKQGDSAGNNAKKRERNCASQRLFLFAGFCLNTSSSYNRPCVIVLGFIAVDRLLLSPQTPNIRLVALSFQWSCSPSAYAQNP